MRRGVQRGVVASVTVTANVWVLLVEKAEVRPPKRGVHGAAKDDWVTLWPGEPNSNLRGGGWVSERLEGGRGGDVHYCVALCGCNVVWVECQSGIRTWEEMSSRLRGIRETHRL